MLARWPAIAARAGAIVPTQCTHVRSLEWHSVQAGGGHGFGVRRAVGPGGDGTRDAAVSAAAGCRRRSRGVQDHIHMAMILYIVAEDMSTHRGGNWTMAQDATIHIKLARDVDARLRDLARARGTSKGQLVREAISACYQVAPQDLPLAQRQALAAYQGGYISAGRLAKAMGMHAEPV